MQCGGYTESIQELTDGTLGPIRRAELERHLEGCADCRALVRDLRAIRDAAADLEPVEPPARVWLQVAGRLRQEGRVTAAAAVPAERYRLLLALAATLVLAVGLATILLVPGGRGSQPSSTTAATSPDSAAAGNAGADTTVQGVEAEFRLAEEHYQNAIAKLEEAARLDQSAAPSPASDTATLDAQTAAMLQKNLRVIDDAIAESRAALRDQPQSAPARDSLFDALKRKVALLQDTIALMNEMRKGNAAGAAQIIQDSSKS